MEYRSLEIAIERGDYDMFCEALKNIPPGEFPQLKLLPKLNLASESEENAEVYIGLLNRGISADKALEYSKTHKSLESALKNISESRV